MQHSVTGYLEFPKRGASSAYQLGMPPVTGSSLPPQQPIFTVTSSFC